MPDTLIDSVLLDFFVKSSDRIIPVNNVHLINQFLSSNDNEEKTDIAQRLMIQTIRNLGFETHCIERILQGYITSLLKVDYGFPWITKDYRSHYLHSVYNYLMGLYLMKDDFLGNMLLANIDFEKLDNIYMSPSSEVLPLSHHPDYERFHRRWAITAFFHDIAYLPQISYNAMNMEAKHHFHTTNQVFSVTIPHFEDIINISGIAEIENSLTTGFVPPYLLHDNALDIISHRLQGRLGKFSSNQISDSIKRIAVENFVEEYGSHDILGGLEAIKGYYHELGIFLNSSETTISYASIIRIIQEMKDFTDAISNASLHHYDKFKEGIFSKGYKEKISGIRLPLLYLLILVDELQVWNRELVCQFKPIAFNDFRINDTALSDNFKDNWTNMLLRLAQSYRKADLSADLTLEIPFTKNLIKQIKKLEKSGSHKQEEINELINTFEYRYQNLNLTESCTFSLNPVLSQLRNIGNYPISNYELTRIIGILESSWKEFSANHQTYCIFMEYLMLFEDLLHEYESFDKDLQLKLFKDELIDNLSENELTHYFRDKTSIIELKNSLAPEKYIRQLKDKFVTQLYLNLLSKHPPITKLNKFLKDSLFEGILEREEQILSIVNEAQKAFSANIINLISKYLIDLETLYTQLKTSDQLWIPIECITYNRLQSMDHHPLEHLELNFGGKATQSIQLIIDRCLEDFKKHFSIQGSSNQVLFHLVDKVRNHIQKILSLN